MRLDPRAVNRIARQQGLSLTAALRRAGVSRTAFYSLTRRPSALPRTVTSLARALGVPPSRLLLETPGLIQDRAEDLVREARRIRARNRRSDFANLWHTLNLLEVTPTERLARSLARGRTRPVHR
jgi:lambda repressor-like predicted transcriptional regulator